MNLADNYGFKLNGYKSDFSHASMTDKTINV